MIEQSYSYGFVPKNKTQARVAIVTAISYAPELKRLSWTQPSIISSAADTWPSTAGFGHSGIRFAPYPAPIAVENALSPNR